MWPKFCKCTVFVIILGFAVTQSHAQEYLDTVNKASSGYNDSDYQTSEEEIYENYSPGSGSGSVIIDNQQGTTRDGSGSGSLVESSDLELDEEYLGSGFDDEVSGTNLGVESSGSELEIESSGSGEMEDELSESDVESEPELGLEIATYEPGLEIEFGSGSGVESSAPGVETVSSETSSSGMGSGMGSGMVGTDIEVEKESSGSVMENEHSGDELESSGTVDKSDYVEYDTKEEEITNGTLESDSGDTKNATNENESDDDYIQSSLERTDAGHEISNESLISSVENQEENLTLSVELEENETLFDLVDNPTTSSSSAEEGSTEDITDPNDEVLNPDQGQSEDIGCEYTSFGCCADGIHPAHGPNELGCCSTTEFGCCADNLTPAKGPYEEGCYCKETNFGCCPDERTPATGLNYQGCGCQYSEFGCCPDQSTLAKGPSYEGCSCETYEFGCCPDGKTVAQGTNFEGCQACNSEFGCCPDEVTPKQSENAECGCEASRYGCCLDGETTASGFDFQGCPKKPGEYCHLKPEQGPCSNYTSKWFYDMEWGGCNRFWYGGCDPGRNHFDDEPSCKNECFEPRGAGACFLKKVKGPCDAIYNEWYFDQERKTCSQFAYSGCLGNSNRFMTKQDCMDMCMPQDDVPVCGKPKAEGACAGDFPRFFYNGDTGNCEPFSYSGCLGNNNRFLTMAECESSCLHKARQKLTDTVCKMYIERGNCDQEKGKANATLPRWGYDERMRRCVPFFYAGCGGNENNFESREACEGVCPTTFPPIITLPRGDEILVERNTQELNLPVSVRASPPPKVMWIRNGKEISPFDYRYEILSDFSLTIKEIGELDAGLYTITADNGIGNIATQVLEVIVFPLFPKVDIKIDKSIFKPETRVTIPCTIRGYPPPEVQWFKLGRSRNEPTIPLQENRPHLTIETYQTTTTITVSNIIIETASDEDSGNYRCLAKTQSYPDVSDTQTIQIQYGPGQLCIDRPSYKHCAQIVRYKFCGNRYYGQYCCRSCTEAGYVPGGLVVR